MGNKTAFRRQVTPAADLASRIPDELVTFPNWINWRQVQRKGKWTKPPVDPHNGRDASSDDPSTWGTFAEAMSHHAEDDRSLGVGFVFTENLGIVGIDLDNCVNAEGNIALWAKDILQRFPTYAEVSPSMHGIKLLCRGPALSEGGKNRRDWPEKDAGVEMYRSGRYFTITGHKLPDHPREIVDCSEAVQWLYGRLLSAGKKDRKPLSDDDIVRVASKAKNGAAFAALYRGEWEGKYPSQSEADLALCNFVAFYTGANAARIEAIVSASGLGQRGKWSEREDYRKATVAKALQDRTEFFGQRGGETTETETVKGDADLEKAREVLLRVEALVGPDGASEESFARDAAILYTRDPGAWARLNALLDSKFGRKFRRSDFVRTVRFHARQLPSVAIDPSDDDLERGDPHGWFPESGVMAGSIIPRGWTLAEDGRICRLTERATQDGNVSPSLTPVCGSPIFVVGVGVDLAMRTHTLQLAWRKGDRWFRAEFGRGECAEGKGLKALADLGFSISCITWNLLAEWLVRYEETNHHLIPRRFTTSRLGPVHDEDKNYLGFMAGRMLVPSKLGGPQVVFRGLDSGDDQIADSIHTKGKIEKQIAALGKVSSFPRVVAAMYTAVAPVILEMIGGQNFGVDIWGDTSLGKTRALMIAASLVGNPEPRGGGLVGTWDGTRTAFERRACVLNGLPVFADESQRARNPEEMGLGLYDVINGLSRMRGTLKGLAVTHGTHVTLLSNGERPVTHVLPGASGAKARMISLHGSPFGEASPRVRDIIDDVTETLSKNYGHILPAFVKWLHVHEGEKAAWRERWEEERAAYRVMAKGNNVAGRLADYLATLEVAAWLLHRAIPSLPWKPDGIIEQLWPDVERGADEADVCKAAMEKLINWAKANPSHFIGKAKIDQGGEPIEPPGGWFGLYSETGLWEWSVFPHVLDERLRAWGFDASIAKTWGERGWTVTTPSNLAKGVMSMVVRHGNGTHRVYAFSRKKVAKIEKFDKDEEPKEIGE